ncbi:MAG: hypothetical protein ACPG32_15640, partial [Akkermansiaceae bacterium]
KASIKLTFYWLQKRDHLSLPIAAAVSGTLIRFDFTPPPSMLLPIYVLVLSAVVSFSKIGKNLIANNSLGVLIIIQSMRIPVELLLHYGSEQEIVPEMLSITGWNYDLISGIGAAVIGGLLTGGIDVNRRVIWLWNFFGIGCLIMIFFIAVTSNPLIRAWGDDPKMLNTWVLYWPYVLLPCFLVVVAVSGHILVTRKLMQK